MPEPCRVARAEKNFHAVFAGVTGARDRNRHFFNDEIDHVISCRKLHILPQQIMEEIDHARSLNGDASEIRAAIFQLTRRRPFLEVPFQPCKILFDLRGIDDEQKFSLADSLKNQIINDAAVIIEKKSVLPLTDHQLRYIIGQHGIEPVARAISRYDELSHVRNIEHSDSVSDGLMFVHNAGVLHRLEQAAERYHSLPQPPAFLVKRRFFLRGFAHASILNFKESGASIGTQARQPVWRTDLEVCVPFCSINHQTEDVLY